MSFSAVLPLLSPLVTKILELSGFPPHLKTRDLHQAFAVYEDEQGGFKIKWVDDTTALIIFSDAATAKKAYLRTIMSPPEQLINDTGIPAKIVPYDKDDASSIISSVSNRQRARSNAGGIFGSPTKQPADLRTPSPAPATPESSPSKSIRGHAHTPSFGRSFGHRRQQSGSNPSLPPKPVAAALFDAANGGPSPANRVLAGVDTLNGIAGLPANPANLSGIKMSRNGSNGTSSDSISRMTRTDSSDSSLHAELTKLSLQRATPGAGSRPGSANAPSPANDGLMGPPLARALANRHPGLVRNVGTAGSSASNTTASSTGNSRTSTPHPTPTTVG